MANRHRGEVEITIAGRKHAVAMTLDFLGRVADALGAETMRDVEARIPQFRPADMRPVLDALLRGNGIEASPEALGQVTLQEYAAVMTGLWNVRPAEDDELREDPPKAAA